MFSFVVPVLNEEERLADLLSDLADRFPGAERVVVDGGSSDRSVHVALQGAHVVLTGERGRAAQMNLGANASKGDWLCFLHADTTPLFDESQLQALDSAGARWSFCDVVLEGRSRGLSMVSYFMNRRSRLTSVATGDQLLLVRRDLFDHIGGVAQIPLMEDVEICKRLRRESPPSSAGLRVASSGRRWDEQGLVRTIARMWLLRLVYWMGVSPARLWSHYYGDRSLAPARRQQA